MHIFLTGEIQVGKSTLIRGTLARFPELVPAGFRTRRHEGAVYILPAAGAERYGAENRVGLCRRPKEAYPAVFDRLGVALLEGAESARLILMDEIGVMEADASGFCARVAALLDGDTPILGVARKQGSTPLLERIRTHPDVRLVTVTAENRDALAEELFTALRRELGRRAAVAAAKEGPAKG